MTRIAKPGGGYLTVEERRPTMTPLEKSTLNRVSWIIEGVSYGVDDKVADALIRAVAMLEGLLEGGQDNG